MNVLERAVNTAATELSEVIFDYEDRKVLVAFRKSCDEVIGYFRFVDENDGMLVAGPEIYRVVTTKPEEGIADLVEHMTAVLSK